MTELANYERAIVLSFELVQTHTQSEEQRAIQSEAALYRDRIENAPRGWTLTLSLLRSTQRAEVKFYCLQTIQRLLTDNDRYAQLVPEDQVSLRTLFMTWVRESCSTLHQEARFVKSKLGVVIALFVKRQFPAVWPNAFEELLQLLPIGLGGADVLVLTLTALDEEVISAAAPEATTIKDTMRLAAVPKLISALGVIALVYSESNVDLVRRTWIVCGMYVDWVDINLTTDEQFLRVWFTHCVNERYRSQAIAALSRLMQKGMDSSSKLRLIHQLGLADACVSFCVQSAPNPGSVMHKFPQLPSAWSLITASLTKTAPTDDEFMLEAARFCQHLGLQLLECRKTLVANGDLEGIDLMRPLMDRALFCMFSFMSRIDKIDVQNAVLEFANRIVMCNKDVVGLNGKEEIFNRANFIGPDAVHQMLFAVLASVRLPNEYNFNSIDSFLVDGELDKSELGDGGDGEEFREHRGNIKRLFLNLVRCATPAVVLPFLRSITEQCLASLTAKSPPHDAEAVLYLVHAFGEGAAEITQRQGPVEDIAGFDQVLLAVFQSPAFQGPGHPAVANMFNELAARYVIALRAQSADLIAHVVGRVTGLGGIHHPNSKVRARAASLLLRIVRSLENSCAPISERILIAVQDVLSLPYELCEIHFSTLKRRVRKDGTSAKRERPLLQVPEVVLVYEAVGIITGSHIYLADVERRRMYLHAVVGPLQNNLQSACNAVTTMSQPDKLEEVVYWGACQLEAFASLAKGFALQTDAPNISALWKEVLRTSLMATMSLESRNVDTEVLLNNLRRLCHSMIRTIGTEILVYFADICQVLLEAPNSDICRALPLLNQMMSTFRSKMHQTLVTSLLPILRATNARITPVANRPQPTIHDKEELLALEKELFTFLLSIVSSDLSSVFFEGTNRNHLEELLRMITDGMASIPDATIQRICAATLLSLCKEWLGVPSHLPEDLQPAFLQFTFERITPASFQATVQPHFDQRDAASNALLTMVCTLHRTLFELCGQKWLEYVSRVFLPSVNCPPHINEEYCKVVSVSKNPKEIRGHFRKLFIEDTKQ